MSVEIDLDVDSSMGFYYTLYYRPLTPPKLTLVKSILSQVRIQGGGGPGPPPTLGFEAPKLSIFGPYLIFP